MLNERAQILLKTLVERSISDSAKAESLLLLSQLNGGVDVLERAREQLAGIAGARCAPLRDAGGMRRIDGRE